MKRAIALLLIVLSVASVASTARAQSTDSSFFEPIYWSGFYAGINAGTVWSGSTWSSAVGSNQFNTSGGLVGGTAGYNRRFDRLVLGWEADVDWSEVGGNSPGICGETCESRNDWLSTVRGRVGYAIGQFMPYITGGVAVGDLSIAGPVGVSSSWTRLGWTAGLGFEYALTENWNLKAEYLRVDLGHFDCGGTCLAPSTINVNENLIRFGISYRFPASAPVARLADLAPKRPGDTDDPGPKIAKKRQKRHDASTKHENDASKKKQQHVSSATSRSPQREF